MTEIPILTPREVLDLSMDPNDAGATSIRGYLVELLATLWREGEGFDSKRPFGNSGWECDLYASLVTAGLVRTNPRGDGWGVIHEEDRRDADRIIAEAIQEMLTPASPADLLAQANGMQAQADILAQQSADLRRTATALRALAGGAA